MHVQAVCHVHSAWSYDGSWSIEQLVHAFGRDGARVLMMTEHDRGFSVGRFAEYRQACAMASSPDVLVIPGIEYSDAANRVHVLVWGPVPFLGEDLTTEAVLEAVTRHGGVAVLAHPGRREAWECVKPAWTEHLLGIEAWNRKYDGWAPGKNAATLLDRATSVPFVGLDFHTRRQMFPLAMSLDVEGELSEDSIIQCLHNRRCAASAFGLPLTGSRLEWGLPLLRMAERGRSKAAAARRYLKSRGSRGPKASGDARL
jgi:hypothetical protein